jgi:hypothetical protein
VLAEQVLTRQSYPREWAKLKTTSAIWFMLTHEADPEIGEQSLRLFDEALEVVDVDKHPVQCASIHGARGLAYSTIRGDDPVGRLREAVRSCRLAAELYEQQGMTKEAGTSRMVLAGIETKLAALM